MNQNSNPSQIATFWRSPALWGASYMILAGLCFALANLCTQYLTMELKMASPIVAFGQYFIGFLGSLPTLRKVGGFSAMRTDHLIRHLLRVLCAILGVQAWIAGLAHVQIWQASALILTSPFFVTLGAGLFLKEKVGPRRLLATCLGFIGGLIILAPWSDSFSFYAIWPLIASVFWAVTSLITKTLTGTESPESVTVYLLVLMTPINAIFALGSLGDWVLWASWLGLAIIIGSGILTMLAQLLIARSYSVADAAYVQPFDHVKLVFNIAGGWLVFGFAPPGSLWLGAVLIVGASLYILREETRHS